MDVEIVEVRDFLAQVPPFDALPEGELNRLSGLFTVRYFRRETPIMERGSRNHSLYVVRSGAVDILDEDGGLVARGGEGTCFGSITLVSGTTSSFLVQAIEDTLCLLLPDTEFYRLCGDYPSLADFFDDQRADRLQQGLQALHGADSKAAVLRTRVADMIRREPVTIGSDATIRDAAELMTQREVSCLLVMEADRLVGVVTDRDLRRRVLAVGADSSSPVTTIMTADPTVGTTDQLAFEALLTMTMQNIHHLPILDGERAVGVLTTTDIMRLEQASSVYVTGDIAKRTDPHGVAVSAQRLPRIVEVLVRQDATAAQIGRIITSVGDAIEQRLMTLAQERLGPAPVPFCWMVLGSRARHEQVVGSDQDNALILSNSATSQHDAYFTALAQFMIDGLELAGFPKCPGNVMATNPSWRVPLRVWQANIATWIDEPTPQAVLDASIFFDARPVAGDERLFDEFAATIEQQLPTAHRFLAHLTAEATSNEPPLGFFRNFVLDKGEHANTLDIKRGGIAPVVKMARVYALRLGSSEVSTRARILAAAAAGMIESARADDLLDAFEYVSYVRVRHQVDQESRGMTPDNHVAPDTLSSFEKHHLREAFSIIRGAQATLSAATPTGLGG